MKKTLIIFLVGAFIGWNLAKPKNEKVTFEDLNSEYKELVDKGASKLEMSAFYDKAMGIYKQHLISNNQSDAAELLMMSNNKTLPLITAGNLFDTSSDVIKASPELEKVWEYLKSKPLK